MNDKIFNAISNKLSILIRLNSRKDDSEGMSVDEILDLVDEMDLTDSEVAKMFGISAQSLRNARSRKGVKKND